MPSSRRVRRIRSAISPRLAMRTLPNTFPSPSPHKIPRMFAWRRSWLLPVLIGAFVFSVYILTFPNDIQGNGDTWLRYEMTQSIMDHRTPYYSDGGTPTWVDKRSVPGIDHHRLVTIYDPGQIFGMIPG